MPFGELTRFVPVKTVQATQPVLGHLHITDLTLSPDGRPEPRAQGVMPTTQARPLWAPLTLPRPLLRSDPKNFIK